MRDSLSLTYIIVSDSEAWFVVWHIMFTIFITDDRKYLHTRCRLHTLIFKVSIVRGELFEFFSFQK